jgi:hypothetical protein
VSVDTGHMFHIGTRRVRQQWIVGPAEAGHYPPRVRLKPDTT